MVHLSWRHRRTHSPDSAARADRPRRAWTLGIAGLALAVALPVQPTPVAALGWSPLVDAPSDYDAQDGCRKSGLPGTQALARWLLRSYPATRSMGMIRGCGVGGTSEHKDGRAFDWGADAGRPRTRKAAYHFIRTALASDAAGNPAALARRLGIMYFIYDDTIWASYRDFAPRPYRHSACRTVKRCSRTLRHLDHVHISLGKAGAAGQTSWYRARNVASLPVLFSGTNQLDPDATAVTALNVPATSAVITSPYLLRAGVTYRFVVTGTVRYGAGQVGDANCTSGPDGWTPTERLPLGLPQDLFRSGGGYGGFGGWGDTPGSDQEDSPSALPLPTSRGLALAAGLRWGEECRADHTYEAWFTPLVNQRLSLSYLDLARGDNSGSLTLYVARDDITASSLVRQ